jgi:hypothetical protein
VEARPSLQENQRKRRDTQTCNAFEASAAHTPGQGSGASVGSLRRKMRRHPGQGGLAVRASGERVQIAVLLGVATLAGQGPIHQIICPVNPSCSPSTLRQVACASSRQTIEPLSLPAAQLLIDHAHPGAMSTSPSFHPSGLGRARRKTSIPSLQRLYARCTPSCFAASAINHSPDYCCRGRPWVALPTLSALECNRVTRPYNSYDSLNKQAP